MTRSPAETAHLLTLDLYGQVLALREENARLRAVLAAQSDEAAPPNEGTPGRE